MLVNFATMDFTEKSSGPRKEEKRSWLFSIGSDLLERWPKTGDNTVRHSSSMWYSHSQTTLIPTPLWDMQTWKPIQPPLLQCPILSIKDPFRQCLNTDKTHGNAKCRNVKKLTCMQCNFEARVYLSEAQSQTPPPLTHCIRVYSILMYTLKWGGGRVEPERRGEGQQGRSQITQLGWKYQHVSIYTRNWLSPVYNLKLW
jgi:hypothetical protein